MKSTIRLIIALLFFGGWALAALAVYVIRTPEHVVIVPKDRLSITDTFVDTRNWSIGDAAGHPDLINRLLATHQADVLEHVTKSTGYDDLASQLAEAAKAGAAQSVVSATTAPAAKPPKQAKK